MSGLLGGLPAPIPDPILRIMGEFAADPRADKIDLGVGVYRTAQGTTPVMAAVRSAEQRIWTDQRSKSYTALSGDAAFRGAIAALVLGEATAQSERLATAATPGGTGAVRQGYALIQRARPDARVWISAPTWPNHDSMLSAMGMPWRRYRYHDPGTGGLDWDGMRADLETLAEGDVVLLHGCCHNPTGADLSAGQWAEIADLLMTRGAVAMVDLAYQGFGAGLESDVAGIRVLAETLPELLVAVSGSKTFGLYRERVGALLALCPDARLAGVVDGTLSWLNRQVFAFPPDHGARVVTEILTDAALRADWTDELEAMRKRIEGNRRALADALRAETGSDRFGFLAANRGMFSLIGADPAQVTALRQDHGVYVIGDGRINLAGLTDATVEPVARAFASVLG